MWSEEAYTNMRLEGNTQMGEELNLGSFIAGNQWLMSKTEKFLNYTTSV